MCMYVGGENPHPDQRRQVGGARAYQPSARPPHRRSSAWPSTATRAAASIASCSAVVASPPAPLGCEAVSSGLASACHSAANAPRGDVRAAAWALGALASGGRPSSTSSVSCAFSLSRRCGPSTLTRAQFRRRSNSHAACAASTVRRTSGDARTDAPAGCRRIPPQPSRRLRSLA